MAIPEPPPIRRPDTHVTARRLRLVPLVYSCHRQLLVYLWIWMRGRGNEPLYPLHAISHMHGRGRVPASLWSEPRQCAACSTVEA